MKKIALTILSIFICSNLVFAQMPMGGGARPQGRLGGKRPPMHNNGMRAGDQNDMLMNIPDIPDLKLEQREKLSKAISDERKEVSKLMDEKVELQRKSGNPGMAEKERQKLMEKISKTEDKIKKKEEKYDKKYRSILSQEQYRIFTEKKKEIEFKGIRRQQRNDRPTRPDNGERPEMPDDNIF